MRWSCKVGKKAKRVQSKMLNKQVRVVTIRKKEKEKKSEILFLWPIGKMENLELPYRETQQIKINT